MNGRIYDPHLGRMLQADPFVQFPTKTQSYNRYSYVLNNPLSATDPSGYFSLKDAFKVVAVFAISYVTYGAASGWAMGAAMNSSYFMGAYGLSGASIAAGAAGGAAAGFSGGVSMAAFSGAGIDDSLKASLQGAATGAISGGFAGYGHVTPSSVVPKMASGAINGGLLTGSGEGAARGAFASFIPVDLGLTEAYRSNELANFAINHAADYAKGYVIDGSSGGKTNLYGGIFNRTVGYGFGLWASKGSLATFREGVYVYEDQRNIFSGGEAITLGNSVIGSETAISHARTFRHEIGHFYNQSNLGASYLPVHAISMGLGMITSPYYDHPMDNPWFFMEQAPLKDVPYSELYRK